jgi:acetyl esterase/lipase
MQYSAELEQHVEEARAANQQLAQLPPMSFDTVDDIRQLRAFLDSPDSPFVTFVGTPVLPVAELSIPGPAGPIPARVIRPERVDAVYLDVHGGGWMIGSPRMNDMENDELARAAGVATVSIDYRMAPEHRLEDAIDDCVAAARWLIEHAGAELGSDRLLIGGGSAGGHLAAVTLLRLRDQDTAAGSFLGANLVFGCYDLSGTPSSRQRRGASPVLPPSIFEGVRRHVLRGRRAEEARDPAISPLYADLSGLPPALFTVGMLDPLLDDSLFMAARWEAAGNEAELAVYPESEHGFTGFPTGMARAARARQQRWVASRLVAPATVT